MPRLALPTDYVKTSATLLEGFETIGEWTKLSTGTLEADTVNYKTGSASLKITTPLGGNDAGTKTINLDMRDKSKLLDLWFYIHGDPSTVSSVALYLSSSATLTKFFVLSYTNNGCFHTGWNKISIARADYTNSGVDDWANTMVRLRVKVTAVAGQVAAVSFDSLSYGREEIPKCLIMFDDGHETVAQEAIPYMYSKGVVGNIYMISSYVDNTVGFMTKANCDDAYAKGWALGNHTNTHPNMGAYTQAQAEAEISACRDWLIANGYTRACNHLAYPNGAYNDGVLAGMANLGMTTGRTTKETFQYAHDYPYELTIRNIINTTTLATAKSHIDNAIKRKTTVMLLMHHLVESPTVGTEWGIANFQALIDYIVARNIDVVTIDEWYEGLTNPRKKVTRTAV